MLIYFFSDVVVNYTAESNEEHEGDGRRGQRIEAGGTAPDVDEKRELPGRNRPHQEILEPGHGRRSAGWPAVAVWPPR